MSENILEIARRVRVTEDLLPWDDPVVLAEAVERMTAALQFIRDELEKPHPDLNSIHICCLNEVGLREFGIPMTEEGDE